MKLILHPGHSKCGSTTIQQAIIKNRQELKKFNIIVPDPQLRIEGDVGFNPHGETPRQLFRFAMEKNSTEELESKIEKIHASGLNNNTALIISAENLVNQLARPSGQNIHKLFKRFFSEIKVVYYIKRQDDFILSAWQQWGYKKGKTLREYVEECLRVRNPNYAVAARFFGRAYGFNNMEVVPVNKKYLYSGSLLEDFFYRIGVPSKGLDLSLDNKNRSMNPAICQVLSRVPHLFRDVHDEQIKLKLSNILDTEGLLFARFDEALSLKVRNQIMNFYSEDNRFLHQKFFESIDFDDVFALRETSSDGTLDEIRAEIESLYQVMALQMQLIMKLIEKR